MQPTSKLTCSRLLKTTTGTRRDRPELARLLDHLRPGDVVTVTRLDRLARSTRDLLDIAERIQEAGAGLRSLAEPWADTTTAAGRMVLTVFAGIAEFERSLIIDRTRSGREAAKARGVKFGPKPTLSGAQIDHARELIDQEGRTVKEAAALLGVHRSTLYRALERSEAVAAVGDQVERQEEGPCFLDDGEPLEPPAHVSTVRLREILAGLPDAELALWPARLAAEEIERRQVKNNALNH